MKRGKMVDGESAKPCALLPRMGKCLKKHSGYGGVEVWRGHMESGRRAYSGVLWANG